VQLGSEDVDRPSIQSSSSSSSRIESSFQLVGGTGTGRTFQCGISFIAQGMIYFILAAPQKHQHFCKTEIAVFRMAG
jgi:hypothetical protein